MRNGTCKVTIDFYILYQECLGLVVGVYGTAARVAISGRRSSPKFAQALIIIIGVSLGSYDHITVGYPDLTCLEGVVY
jgi:hypothetical protein